MAKMKKDDLCKTVESLVQDAVAFRDQQSYDRIRAMEYYDGKMTDTPANAGRSRVVSRDVRGEIKKVLPSILRIILGNDKVVEYQPAGRDDEDVAEQATDYINNLIFPESEGPNAVRDAIDDALRLRNGIIKWWQDERIEVKVSEHSGLDDMAFNELVSDDDVEVLEHTERVEETDGENGDGDDSRPQPPLQTPTLTPPAPPQPGMAAQMGDVPQMGVPAMQLPTVPSGPVSTTVHDVKIRRKTKRARARLGAIPPENFLIHPDATTILEAPIVGEHLRLRRSDLVAMGYDRKTVEDMPVSSGSGRTADIEEQTRRRDIAMRDDPAAKAMQEVDYYELLVRVDFDNDGIAELRRMVFGGGLNEKYLLENEPWDEIYYADVVCERRPHQWEGNSIFDDAHDIQRIKTVLLRQTMDNLYWQNNLQPIVQEGVVQNPESVLNPDFGEPIRVGQGVDVRSAIGYSQVPFVADKSFQMLSYLDEQLHDRTGINDASGGMAPDALQNMTATASAMLEQAGIGQTEMMVRTIANCLKPVFKGLLKLVIQHQDKPRTVRLRNEWVEYDPRTWNADMDVTVNTGLGAGTRERDMTMMQFVMGVQEKILAALGPDNPLIKPDQIYNCVSKAVEAAGLKSPDMFFTKPDPQEVQQRLQAAASKPSPEQEKIQGQLQIEQAKGQVQVQLADKKMQVDANREQQQRDADLVVKQAELEKETQAKIHDSQIKAQGDAAKIALEHEKIASHERIEAAKLTAQMQLEREKMDRADAQAAMNREHGIAQSQAASLGKTFDDFNKKQETAQ